MDETERYPEALVSAPGCAGGEEHSGDKEGDQQGDWQCLHAWVSSSRERVICHRFTHNPARRQVPVRAFPACSEGHEALAFPPVCY